MNSFLLEIGVEEMPVQYIQPAVNALSKSIFQQLDHLHINHGPIMNFSTPRRFTILIKNVANKQKSITKRIYGPPKNIAFDNDGKYSISAIRFANKIGVSTDQLEITNKKKGKYLSVNKTEYGQETISILEKILPKLILSIPFPKSMRWSNLSVYFARPIRTIVAVLGPNIVNVKIDNSIKSSKNSTGHPYMNNGYVTIYDPDKYLDIMRKVNIIADVEERRNIISRDVNKAARNVGGKLLNDENLLDIVTNLVEFPVTVVGKFDEAFLGIPKEILITSMREQQKYFSVVNDNGDLMPTFIVVNNIIANNMDLIILGHERVLRARLSDAKFFYDSDVNEALNSIEMWVNKLRGVLFHNKLGSMYDKVVRIKSIALYLTSEINSDFKEEVIRATHLCKSDLVSRVVSEFPKLQGLMGSIYAKLRGESENVYEAIQEHYLPLNSGGKLPETEVGAIVSIADKIDSICGCFSIGLIPTSSADPYALRRQAIGLLEIIRSMKLDLNLKKLIEIGMKQHIIGMGRDSFRIAKEICDFISRRLYGLLINTGYSSDIVTAVIEISPNNVIDTERRILAIEKFKKTGPFDLLVTSFKRIHNILSKHELIFDVSKAKISEQLLQNDFEIDLYKVYCSTNDSIKLFLEKNNFKKAINEMIVLFEPINLFFDQVMVMVDDKNICHNRITLLNVIYEMFLEIADFSKIYV